MCFPEKEYVNGMKKDKEFQPFSDDNGTGIKSKYFPKQTVIKNRSVNIRFPFKIEIDESAFDHKENGSIEPIVENGEIVGVVYRCSCGKIAKTRFEYVKTEESSRKTIDEST